VEQGIRLGIDPGQARIGVALSDRDGLLAMPSETIPVNGGELDRLAELVAVHEVSCVIVGLPLNLSGKWTASTRAAHGLARALAGRIEVPVRMIDERLTTNTANAALRASGRSQRSGRSVIDQIAAVSLLQQALDTERQQSRPPGWALEEIMEPRDD
jgi:putative Holliday junction resolvase